MFRRISVLLFAISAAAPLAADTVLTIRSHTDAFQMMGQNTPAEDSTYTYWYGDGGVRYDMGETSILLRPDRKKFYVIDHAEKNYSALDVPLDMSKMVSPDMAPMMEQMARMMAVTTTVTPTGRTGEYGGRTCKFTRVDISMPMMTMSMDQCLTEDLPIDWSKYKEIAIANASLAPNQQWMKDLAQKLDGFPVRTDSTTTMMGKELKSWQQLESVEEKEAPVGTYEVPAGYSEVRFDPMAQAAGQRRR